MLLEDVSSLFARLPQSAPGDEYVAEIVEMNSLGKPTRMAQGLACRHIAALYGPNPRLVIFRALRRLWDGSELARPALALTAALARDPLLRGTQSFISHKHPGRFSPASLKSFAQNVNGTWAQAGYLLGPRGSMQVATGSLINLFSARPSLKFYREVKESC